MCVKLGTQPCPTQQRDNVNSMFFFLKVFQQSYGRDEQKYEIHFRVYLIPNAKIVSFQKVIYIKWLMLCITLPFSGHHPSPVLISLVWVWRQGLPGLWFKAYIDKESRISVPGVGYFPLSKLVRGVLENHSPQTQYRLLTLFLLPTRTWQ